MSSTATITLTKTKYDQLLAIAEKFELIKSVVGPALFGQPLIRDTKRVIKEFKETGCYNDDFLKSLEEGLKDSVYFNSVR